MKTLYININNEQIQSNDELEVLNYDLDSDFFFYLGEKIAKGCKVENENALITDFNTQDAAEDYQQIIAQWNEIKAILFGEDCDEDYEFKLPAGYIHWLKYHPQYVSVYDKNFSHGESGIIYIDLEELYEESVESMQRRILRKLQRDDLYRDIDEIVFNDDAVTRKSPIILNIKDKYEGVGFKAYKKWSQEENEMMLHSIPQICEKYKKNPCECNFEEQCCYAVEIKTGPSWTSERKYKFFNHNGQPLDDNEYYIVAEGVADKVFRKVATYKFEDGDGKTNLLVIKTEGDPTLYYISSNGKFYKIGEYDYENGQRVYNTNQKEYWKYQAYIIQNKYILYKSGLNYTLYEINGNSYPRLLSKFQSKINFVEGGYICRDFLTNGEYTINWKTGELINIPNSRFSIILGYNNDSPIYLIPPKRWDPKTDYYYNSSVVDSEGNFLWKFKANTCQVLSNNLLLLDSGKNQVKNLDGKTIINTNDSIDEVKICGYDCLIFDEKIYIISKDKLVDYLSESVYVIVKDYTAHVYNIHTDELLSILNMPESIYSADGSSCSDSLYECMPDDLYAIPFEEWGDQGDIYSISHCKKIYTTIGNERFCKSNKDKFAIEGESYFEIYDNIGKLLLTFEKDDDYTPKPELHDNGYISWFNKKQGRVEYYDALLNPYYINIDDRLNINFESIAITVLSERCVIIRSEEKDFVFVDNEYVCKCHKLKQYDENNYYEYSCDEDGLYCAVNAKNGITNIPDTIIAGCHSKLYMVK